MPFVLAGVVCLMATGSAATPKASAHRGDNAAAPENTVPAFASAVRKGAHQIEFDVHLTKDGVPIVMHDSTVDRTTDGTGAVADLTFAELRGLDAGSWFRAEFAGVRVPTVNEALEAIPGPILCNIQLKNAPGVAEAVTRLIVAMDRLDQCFLACSVEQAEAARAIAPRIRICNMSGPRGTDPRAYTMVTTDSGASFIQFKAMSHDILPDAVAQARNYGLKVNYFKADAESDIRAAAEAGVDYILTDNLDLCLSIVADHGTKPVAIPHVAKACAHRGDGKAAPENTVPAFRSAVEKGTDQIEFDVYLSKDGHPVVIHDTKVDRTTNGTGNVTDLTFDELRALDAGSWFAPEFAGTQIPTLRETLDAIPDHVTCNVHLKNAPGVAEAATEVIVDMGRLDQCFLACTVDQAEAARAITPYIKVCNMFRQSGPRDTYIDITFKADTEYIQLLGDLEGLEEAVDQVHARGVTVNFFGASEADKIAALAAAGVDYILTDDLDTCLAVLADQPGR
ncbi:MAG: hypothetical protein GY851_23680 [bacterium]|nr:hypothetical protein [bacterium]